MLYKNVTKSSKKISKKLFVIQKLYIPLRSFNKQMIVLQF